MMQYPDLLTMGFLPLQVGDTLEEFLLTATKDAKLRQILMSLSEACRTIAYKVRFCAGRCARFCTAHCAAPNCI